MSLDLSHTFQKAKTKQTGKLNLKDTLILRTSRTPTMQELTYLFMLESCIPSRDIANWSGKFARLYWGGFREFRI